MKALLPFLSFCLLVMGVATAQGVEPLPGSYEWHMARASELSELFLLAESRNELEEAISIAQEEDREREYINASISLAELLRKAGDNEEGIELLHRLEGSEKYPELHVRLLGRMAALHHEKTPKNYLQKVDSVRAYLSQALPIAEKHGLVLEAAGLRNELSFLPPSDPQGNISLYKEISQTFLQRGDTHNAASVLCNLLDAYQTVDNCEATDSIAGIIAGLLEGENWYDTEMRFFGLMAVFARNAGDSLAFLNWELKQKEAKLNKQYAIGSRQMDAFRVMRETKKYQEQAALSALEAQSKQEQLDAETARTRELFAYVGILGILAIGVIALLFRERTLKHKVNIANEKYHMLLVESNHRIKNNLQMIISMVEYSGRAIVPQDKRMLNRMSGKIHTISALHKHLYLDVHNERVSLDTYFSEIIALYENLMVDGLLICKSIASIKIRSERIVYFGLIFNEMLANTIEHGNSPDRKVWIEVAPAEDGYQFVYRDNSVYGHSGDEGTGITLIRQLAGRVGGRNFTLNRQNGEYRFRFSD